MSLHRAHRLRLPVLAGAFALASACSAPSPRQAAPVTAPFPARAAGDTSPYFAFQVEQQAREQSGTCAPRYPQELLAIGKTGEVRAQFVVDTKGRVEPATFQVIRATDPAFATAVKAALGCVRYTPATIRKQRVRQVVQQPFVFDIQR